MTELAKLTILSEQEAASFYDYFYLINFNYRIIILLSPTNISLAQQRQAQQINTSSDVVHEYAIMIERLQKENQEQRLKIDKKDSEISSLKENVKDLESKQTVHERIEQSLKDKIHQMQQDYYQNNREKASKIQDEELYFQNLIDLQQALVDLEKKFDSKDREVENIHRENQTLHEELQKTESKKQDLIRRIQEHEITILEQESDLNNLGQSFNTVESDCLFYKEKYQQMQVVIDGCSQQMQDFEQVNQMSCELIEKLQQELEFYKQEYETMREFMGVSGPIENEMQQTQYDKIPQRDIVGGEYEGTIRLQDYINNYNYGNIKSLEKSQFDKKQSFIRVDNMENCQNHVMLNSPSGSQFSEYVCPINFKENLLHSYQQTTRIPTASQQSPSRLETENLGQYLSPQYTDNTEYERQPFSYISNYDNNPQVLSQHKIYQDFPEKENNTEMDHSSGKQQKHQNFNHDPLASDSRKTSILSNSNLINGDSSCLSQFPQSQRLQDKSSLSHFQTNSSQQFSSIMDQKQSKKFISPQAYEQKNHQDYSPVQYQILCICNFCKIDRIILSKMLQIFQDQHLYSPSNSDANQKLATQLEANIVRLENEHERKLERFRQRMQQNAIVTINDRQLLQNQLEVITEEQSMRYSQLNIPPQ